MSLRKWSSYVVGLCVLSFSGSFAQETPVRPTYEIASVRPSDPRLPGGSVTPLPNGIGYNAEQVTVQSMLAVMYRIPQRQVVGGPGWVDTENFDVQAKADHAYSTDELHVMFENLLQDRFHMKLRAVTTTGPVYLLTVAKSGLKMTSVDAGTDRHSPITEVSEDHYKGDRVPLNYLCFWLGQNLQSDQRQVVDRTGLHGTYNFSLHFRPQMEPGDASPEAEDLPSLFKALREQLGLELTPQKGPVNMIVIDHIEKPSEN